MSPQSGKEQSRPSPYEYLRCEFFLTHKRRRCAMQRKKLNRFCTQHMCHENNDTETLVPKSIPCPLDNKHNVFVKDLERHLLKCNARPPESYPSWYLRDINLPPLEILPGAIPEINDEDVLQEYCLDILRGLEFPPLPVHICNHPGLDARLSELKNKKHALQQASLIGNLHRLNLLSHRYFYVELGCGKAELSRFVNSCITRMPDVFECAKPITSSTPGTYGFGLIDRGVNRLKADNKIAKEAGPLVPNVKRSRIDIKDLDVDEFLRDTSPCVFVGISKHLCGVATDLLLRMLQRLQLVQNQHEESRFGGVLIAMCCRHICSWQALLPGSREYLMEHGIRNAHDFACLKRAASWAVSNIPETCDDDTSAADKKALGFTARRLLDESRVYALRQTLDGYKVEMFIYADLEVTLENVCLLIN